MDDNQTENMGPYARHPLRTMGMAFLAGAAVGMTAASVKKPQKSTTQKIMDQLGL